MMLKPHRHGHAIGTVSVIALFVFGIAFITPASAAHITCGQVITEDTTLDSDLGPCPGDGIIVGADNITLNLGGHRIFGNGDQGAAGEFAGIRLPGRTGVVVVGGAPGATVDSFEAGVLIRGGSDNLVANITARDNIGPPSYEAELGDGIVVIRSARNHIRNNVVMNNGIYNGIGIWGVGADGNRIEGNQVEGTRSITAARPTVNIVDGGYGITVNSQLDGSDTFARRNIRETRIMHNTVRANDNTGIQLFAVEDSTVVRNSVEANGAPFAAANHYCFECGGSGISVTFFFRVPSRATRVQVEANEVRNNAEVGIVISSRDNEIIRNVTGGNRYLDLVDRSDRYLPRTTPCDNNRWFGNVWGEPSAIAAEYGMPPYYPECTSNGGSGPGDGPGKSSSAGSPFDQPEDDPSAAGGRGRGRGRI